jgi:hypothetical protein
MDGNAMRLRLQIFIGLGVTVAALGLAFGYYFGGQSGNNQSVGDGEIVSVADRAGETLEELVLLSPVIVTATTATISRPTDVQSEKMPFPGDPDAGVEIETLAHEIVVSSVLRGDMVPGDRLTFYQDLRGRDYDDASSDQPPEWEWERDPFEFEAGVEYLFFLHYVDGRPRATGGLGVRQLLPVSAVVYARLTDDTATFARTNERLAPGRFDGGVPPDTVAGEEVPMSEILRTLARVPYINDVPPDPQQVARDEKLLARGRALTQLIEDLAGLRTADEVMARVHELGLDAKSLQDPAFCRKVEAGIPQFSSFNVSLGCGGD